MAGVAGDCPLGAAAMALPLRGCAVIARAAADGRKAAVSAPKVECGRPATAAEAGGTPAVAAGTGGDRGAWPDEPCMPRA